MATLYPENQQYIPKSGGTASSALLPGLMKKLQEDIRKTTADNMQKTISSDFVPQHGTEPDAGGETIKRFRQGGGGFELGKLIQPQSERYQPLPSYSKFLPTDIKFPDAPRWVSPTEQAKVSNIPDIGAYTIDPTQPGELIKTEERKLVDYNFKKKLLGGRSTSLFEVDHAIPLWAGGSDVESNLQIFDIMTHQKKTNAQAIPLTLLSAGKINRNQARSMALTWKDKDISNLPNVGKGGVYSIDFAEKIAKQWKEQASKPKPVSFKDVWAGIPGQMKDFGKEWGLPVPIREFGKGLVGGGTAGIVPGTGASEGTGVTGSLSNLAGNIVGTLSMMGLAFRGAGLAFKGITALGRKAGLLKKAIPLSEEAIKNAGLAKRTFYQKARHNTAVFSVFNQLGVTGRELTRQQEFELKNHMYQFLNDMAYGGLTGVAGQTLKGYTITGLGATSIALGEQVLRGEEPDFEEALKTGALMMGFHALGFRGRYNEVNNINYNRSKATFRQYLNDITPNLIPPPNKEGVVKIFTTPEFIEFKTKIQGKFPNDPRLNIEIKNDLDATDFIREVAEKRLTVFLDNSVGKTDIPVETTAREIRRIKDAGRELYKQTLPKNERLRENMKDSWAIAERLKPQITSKQFKSIQRIADDIPASFPKQKYVKPEGIEFPEGEIFTSGVTGKIDPKTEANLGMLYKMDSSARPERIFFIKDPRATMVSRLTNIEAAIRGDKLPILKPEDTVRGFYLETTPEGKVLKPVGFWPTPERIETDNLSMNKNAIGARDRMINIIKKAKDPTEIPNLLKDDIAKPNIDTETAIKLFQQKETLKDIDPQTFFTLVKADNPMKVYKIDNSTISSKMNELNLPYLTADFVDITKTKEGNYHLVTSIKDQNWLESMALRDKKPSPVQETIKEITERKKAIETTERLKEVKEMVKKPEQRILPLEIPAKTPVSKLTVAPETTFAPKGGKVPPEAKTALVEAKMTQESLSKKIEEVIDIPPNKNTEIIPEKGITPVLETSKPEVKISYKDFFNVDENKINKGLSKIIDQEINKTSDSVKKEELLKIKNLFTKENIKKVANDAYKISGNNELSGVDSFIKRISDAFTLRGLPDPITSPEARQSFKKIFRDSVFNKPVKVMTIDKSGKFEFKNSNASAPKSFLEETIGNDVVYFEKTEGKQPELAVIVQRLNENGYVSFIYDNKPDSILGIKFDSSLAGGKKMNEIGALDLFTNSIFTKLGYKKGESTINSIAKRLKSINSKEKINPIKGENWKVYVIKDSSGINKTIEKTTPNFKDIKVNKVVENPEQVKKDLGKKLSIDGTAYTSPENIANMGEKAGFIETPFYLKPTQSFIDPKTGNLFHQKYEMRAWTPEAKKYFEDSLGIKLNSTDSVTVEGNVKEGFGKVGKDMGSYIEVDTPSESLRFKYNHPHERGGSLSLGGVVSKIPHEAGINEQFTIQYKDFVKNLKKLSESIQNSRGSINIDKIWKEYPEFHRDSFMENLHGELKRSAEYGAGLSQLGPILNKTINKIITETYLSGAFFKGDVLHITPDLKFKTNFKTGKKEHLNSGEVMIPRKAFIALYGKEEYESLQKTYGSNNEKEFSVLTLRYPTLKDTSVFPMKVLIAEDHGVKMGKSQIVANSADTMKFDYDTDGDTLQIFKIGGEKGIPKELSDYFLSKSKEGDMIFPSLEKTSKQVFDGEHSYIKLNEYALKTLHGGEVIGITASMARPMRFLKSNDFTIRVIPGSSPKTVDIEYLLNGKIYNQSKDFSKISKEGTFLFKDMPNKFEIKPIFSDKESYMLGLMGQEAVDSVGTTNLNKRLGKKDASDYVIEKLFTNSNNTGSKILIRNALKDFQIPYKQEERFLENIQPFLEKIKNVKDNNGKLGPVEEIVLSLNEIKELDFGYKNPEIQQARDIASTENVKEKFKDEISSIKNKKPQHLVKFIKMYNNVKKSYGTWKSHKTEIMDGYKKLKEKESLNKDQIRDISLWVAASSEANIVKQKGKATGFVIRPISIINDTPDVAKAFFEGEQLWRKIKENLEQH